MNTERVITKANSREGKKMLNKDEGFSDRVVMLEALVEELLNDTPVEQVIEKKMKELAIDYTSDPVERINRVLSALHPYQALDIEGD
jgi:hypothetical protein